MEGQNNSGSFEKQWKSTFEGKEFAAPKNVWSNIDRHLANADATRYKKRVFFYKLLTAASILLILSLSIALYLNYSDYIDVKSELTDIINHSKPEGAIKNTNELVEREDQPVLRAIDRKEKNKNQERLALFTYGEDEINGEDNSKIFYERLDSVEINHAGPRTENDAFNQLPAKKLSYGSPPSLENIVLYRVPDLSLGDGIKNKDKRQLIAGVDITTGSFDPNFQQDNVSAIASNLPLFESSATDETIQIPEFEESTDAGFSYALGFNLGYQVSNRIILEGGLQYGRYSANTNTDVVLRDGNSNETYALVGQSIRTEDVQNAITSEAPAFDFQNTRLNNNFQFASIPLQAGYIVFDDKISLIINAGLSTEIFLSNELKDNNSGTKSISIDNNSPFKTFYFNGITGLELGYKVGTNYRFSIEPNYRRSLNTFTNPGSSFDSNPVGFGVTAGFKYIIK